MDQGFDTRDDRLRRMAEAALAAPGQLRDWPAELRAEWFARRSGHVKQELAFQLKLGMAITVAAVLIDLVTIPAMALTALAFRVATIVPLNVAGLALLRAGKVQQAKLVTALTLALFAASTIWMSSFGGSDVIARFSMASIALLVVSLSILPFTGAEKLRYAVLFCGATFLAGMTPHPIPRELLLQHMVLSLIAGAGSFALVRRMWQFEARDFLRSLLEDFVRAELEQRNGLLRELSESDPLTGLANRRTCERTYEELRKDTDGAGVAVMMIDLDHFKQFNDRHGHQAGDRCLIEVARAMEGCLDRHGGHVARFGGEEFVAILRAPTRNAGADAAEDVRHCLSRLSVDTASGTPQAITASVGLAFSRPAETLGQVIARADEALYRAKQTGRNRVAVSFAASDDLV